MLQELLSLTTADVAGRNSKISFSNWHCRNLPLKFLLNPPAWQNLIISTLVYFLLVLKLFTAAMILKSRLNRKILLFEANWTEIFWKFSHSPFDFQVSILWWELSIRMLWSVQGRLELMLKLSDLLIKLRFSSSRILHQMAKHINRYWKKNLWSGIRSDLHHRHRDETLSKLHSLTFVRNWNLKLCCWRRWKGIILSSQSSCCSASFNIMQHLFKFCVT